MIFSDGFTPDMLRDQQDERPLNLDPTNDWVLYKVYPHGFWGVKRQTGNIPQSLEGVYTTPDRATQDVKAYVKAQNEKEARREERQQAEAARPVLKRKPVPTSTEV